MSQPSIRVATVSLVWCVVVCNIIVILMVTNRSVRESLVRGEISDWVGGTLWAASPYIVLGILSPAFRKKRYLSWWILAGTVIAIAMNQALYYLVFEESNNTGFGMSIGFGPLFTWIVLGFLCVIAAIFCIADSLMQRQK